MACVILGGVCVLFAVMCAQCVSMMAADKYRFIARLYRQHGIPDHMIRRFLRTTRQHERWAWPTSVLIRFISGRWWPDIDHIDNF